MLATPVLTDLAGFAPAFFKALGLGLFLPLLSDNMVRMPWRVAFAIWLAFVYGPLGIGSPGSALDWPSILGGFSEGVLIGMTGRLMLATFQIAASTIAAMSGLQQAVLFNPAEAQQTTSLELLLYFVSLKLFLDHGIMSLLLSSTLSITALTASTWHDGAMLVVSMFTSSIRAAAEIAAPFIVLNIAFGIGLGAANLLLPSLPLFMIGQPVQITAALLLLAAVLADNTFVAALHVMSSQFGFGDIGP